MPPTPPVGRSGSVASLVARLAGRSSPTWPSVPSSAPHIPYQVTGRANTGCESTDDRAYDPVSALVDFSAAWDAQDFVAMEAVATNSVILTAHDWWQAPKNGVVSAITAAEAHAILADCGHPGSLETACQISVGEPGGGPARPLFDLVMLHTDDGNFAIIYLEYVGDGTS